MSGGVSAWVCACMTKPKCRLVDSKFTLWGRVLCKLLQFISSSVRKLDRLLHSSILLQQNNRITLFVSSEMLCVCHSGTRCLVLQHNIFHVSFEYPHF